MIAGAILAGLFTIVGALLVGVFQWINSQNSLDASSASQSVTEEGLDARLEKKLQASLDKIDLKLDRQYELKWRTDWQVLLHRSLSEFIVKTDPDLFESHRDIAKIIEHIHNTTILLNDENIKSHARLNNAIGSYGLYLQGYEGVEFDRRLAMDYHDEVIKAGKVVLYKPDSN